MVRDLSVKLWGIWVWNCELFEFEIVNSVNVNLLILSHDPRVEEIICHPWWQPKLARNLGWKSLESLAILRCCEHHGSQSLENKFWTEPWTHVFKKINLLETRKVSILKFAPVNKHLVASELAVQLTIFPCRICYQMRLYFMKKNSTVFVSPIPIISSVGALEAIVSCYTWPDMTDIWLKYDWYMTDIWLIYNWYITDIGLIYDW